MNLDGGFRQMTDLFSALERKEFQSSRKKVAYVALSTLVLYAVIRGVAAAASKPLWFDELLTLSIASQPTLQEMWNAIRCGFDTQPPLFYLIERAFLALPISKEISLRLPSILSFPVVLVCLFAYVRKRDQQVVGSVCVLAVLCTSLFHMYMFEARGYMLMNACIAFALLCYQRLPSLIWSALLGLTLFLAQSLHYYAVIAMIPFGVAELITLMRMRRVRWLTWLALACGLLPLLAFWSLLQNIKIYYGSQVFSRANLANWTQYYGLYFLTNASYGIALAAVSIVAIISSRVGLRRDTQNHDIAEAALLSSLVLLPVIAFVLMRVIHGVLLDRYTLSAIFGIVLGIASALQLKGRRRIAFVALFIIAAVAIQERFFWRNNRIDPLVHELSVSSQQQFSDIEQFLEKGGHNDLSIVFGQPTIYCQVAHYVNPAITDRFVYLTDQEGDLKYGQADTMFRAVKGLNEFFPLRLEDYKQFMTEHSEFLLYVDGWQTILQALHADRASLELVQIEGGRSLYLVKIRKPWSSRLNDRMPEQSARFK